MNRLIAALHRAIGHQQEGFNAQFVFGWLPTVLVTECECGRRWEW